jgi:hypothetical protein
LRDRPLLPGGQTTLRRAQEKIKDLVEAQAFEEVQDYTTDPARALGSYLFTDATSDLFSRWLDTLADLPRDRGVARALAGLRGVGKSHMLAAFGALAALPDLRSDISDAHVATSARRLLSRRYVVAHIHRGRFPTIREEVSAALAAVLGGGDQMWDKEPQAALAIAASMADAPLVLIIDTAFGRETRVQRDDGPVLGELARAAANLNVFIGLALDDDIAGADGPNVLIAGTYQIDYLDPEHLYRITDAHLFQKNAQSRAALHEMYTRLRGVVPGFNWSEPRFAAVYPMHPLIADVAAAVRLYAPSFAFLPFAAAAGAHAINRPALSLVVLDEVFDRTERDLRVAGNLKEAFAAYDELAVNAIAQIPIMQRLQAKLVLKGLFILSLDGRGATARELGAAMLLYDEARPAAAIERIEQMLVRFAEAAPPGALVKSEEGGETHYRFTINAAANFDAALVAAAEVVAASPAIGELLRALGRARFEDWPFAEAEGVQTEAATEFPLVWRGTGRLGRLGWQPAEAGAAPPEEGDATPADRAATGTNQAATATHQGATADDSAQPSALLIPEAPAPVERLAPSDWKVIILAPGAGTAESHLKAAPGEAAAGASRDALSRAVWQPAELTADEQASLSRLVALRRNDELRAEFGETARAAERTHTALAERIWTRVYLDDGLLVSERFSSPFTEEARAAQTLAEVLGQMLATSLEEFYPLHPVFREVLGESEAATLIVGLFGGASQNEARVQELAQLFAAPLGLVSMRGEAYTLEAGDQLLRMPWVREVLAMTDAADGDVVPFHEVYYKLRREPYGFLHETQQLILAALVAGRRIELITSTGDRISRRTLDLDLKWDEIAGIARIATLLHSAEELTAWAARLTGRSALGSIAEPDAREAVRGALSAWLDAWRADNPLKDFDALPEEGLTTRVWNLASAVRKSFGAAADSVETTLAETISLEEGLQRVADAFDSPEQFARNSEQLRQLNGFVKGLAGRTRALGYLATAEPTNVYEIESARRELLMIARDVHSLLDAESSNRFELLWREFHARYVEHYAEVHDAVLRGAAHRAEIDALTRGDEWREFEALSQLSILNRRYWDEAAELLADSMPRACELPVRPQLEERTICACRFRLASAAVYRRAPRELSERARRGRDSYRRTLALLNTSLAIALDALARRESDAETAARARSLSVAFAQGQFVRQSFSAADVQLLESALSRMTAPPPVRLHLPLADYGLLTREELRARLNQWLDDLPDEPAVVEVVTEERTDGA